jgi:hypothetical protein
MLIIAGVGVVVLLLAGVAGVAFLRPAPLPEAPRCGSESAVKGALDSVVDNAIKDLAPNIAPTAKQLNKFSLQAVEEDAAKAHGNSRACSATIVLTPGPATGPFIVGYLDGSQKIGDDTALSEAEIKEGTAVLQAAWRAQEQRMEIPVSYSIVPDTASSDAWTVKVDPAVLSRVKTLVTFLWNAIQEQR